MSEAKFDTTLRDSQGTEVLPVKPEDFDFDAYAEYEAGMLEKNRKFAESGHGLLVYRRVRANGVFYDKCRDYKESLELQLGALKASMPYQADIANFLEPWYGIGYIASCFGSTYKWLPEQAPSVEPKFSSAQEILDSDFVPIAQTTEGKYNLEMIEYFMDKTKGKVPVSFGDIQSPMNMLTYLLPVTDMFLEIYDDPETVQKAAKLCADLLKDFLLKQQELIGDALARPGHGFASSRTFRGVGLSNDTSIMLQEDDYVDIFKEMDEELGDVFGGVVYHSCGVWEKKIEMVKSYRNIFMADGAFTIETDPSPNRPEAFADAFNGTGIILNARAVGNLENSFAAFEKLWRPKQKLIAVTYCKTVEEQAELYRRLHEMEERG
ncbi:MAG: uroporphyrinogen decarboxylase family protein [Eubacteriales bacterium]|nr:uroporphyrinogen decarboxylase family protein [Eubacteriales bacterium]